MPDMTKGTALRIAHVIGKVAKGGIEAVVFNYYQAIDKSRVQFDFIVDEDSPCEIPRDILCLGCQVYKIPSYRRLLAYMRSLRKIFAEGHYKIVHAHMNTLSVFSLLAAKRAGVPVRIAHSHSTAGKGEFTRNVIKYILRPFSRMFPTHMFACSEYAGRWLFGDRAFDKGGVTVIKNAIDVSKYRYAPDTRERVRKDLGVSDKFVIGHVGRFMPQKNQNFLLDIFEEIHRQNSESVLLLVGDGELKAAAETKSAQLGIADNVVFLGARDDVHELYQAMDVFVLPSLYEGLGIVGVEAQCAGLSCVFSDRVPREVVAGNSAVFLQLESGVENWAKKVLRQAEANGRENESRRCFEKWDIWNEAERLMELYERIVEST